MPYNRFICKEIHGRYMSVDSVKAATLSTASKAAAAPLRSRRPNLPENTAGPSFGRLRELPSPNTLHAE